MLTVSVQAGAKNPKIVICYGKVYAMDNLKWEHYNPINFPGAQSARSINLYISEYPHTGVNLVPILDKITTADNAPKSVYVFLYNNGELSIIDQNQWAVSRKGIFGSQSLAVNSGIKFVGSSVL